MNDTQDLDPDIADARRETFASDIIRLSCLWVAAGALYKLFAGSPGDLPQLVLDKSPLGAAGTFRAAISIELVIVILCLFRPRFGWFWLGALFAVFDALLWPLVQAGEASCGCFGGTITIKPLYMLIIDSTLLVALLVGRPWSAIPKRPLQPLSLVPLIALAVWAPFQMFKDSNATQPPPRPAAQQTPAAGSSTSRGPSVPGPASAPVETVANPGAGAPVAPLELLESAPEPTAPAAGEELLEGYSGWQLKDPLPEWHAFNVADWEGKTLFEIDAYNFLEFDTFPDTCHVIFYRQTCEHCAEHLEQLSLEPPPVPLVLVRMIEDRDTEENKVTRVLPDTPFYYEMPALRRGYGMTTPVTMDVEGYLISNVIERQE